MIYILYYYITNPYTYIYIYIYIHTHIIKGCDSTIGVGGVGASAAVSRASRKGFAQPRVPGRDRRGLPFARKFSSPRYKKQQCVSFKQINHPIVYFIMHIFIFGGKNQVA